MILTQTDRTGAEILEEMRGESSLRGVGFTGDDTYHVGFTGTQKGMTVRQRAALRLLLKGIVDTHPGLQVIGRHGDCTGADLEFHQTCGDVGIPVIIHPPVDDKKRAFADEWVGTQVIRVEQPEEYRVRNEKIVVCSHEQIGAPDSAKEKQRSGTWMTLRMARTRGKSITFCWPDGSVNDVWPT